MLYRSEHRSDQDINRVGQIWESSTYCKSYKMKTLRQIEEDDEFSDIAKIPKTSKTLKKIKNWTNKGRSTKNIRIKDQTKKKNKDRKSSAAQEHTNILNEFCNKRNMIRYKLLDRDRIHSENLDSDKFLKLKRKEYFSAIKKDD